MEAKKLRPHLVVVESNTPTKTDVPALDPERLRVMHLAEQAVRTMKEQITASEADIREAIDVGDTASANAGLNELEAYRILLARAESAARGEDVEALE